VRIIGKSAENTSVVFFLRIDESVSHLRHCCVKFNPSKWFKNKAKAENSLNIFIPLSYF